jgi:hypothetical protein
VRVGCIIDIERDTGILLVGVDGDENFDMMPDILLGFVAVAAPLVPMLSLPAPKFDIQRCNTFDADAGGLVDATAAALEAAETDGVPLDGVADAVALVVSFVAVVGVAGTKEYFTPFDGVFSCSSSFTVPVLVLLSAIPAADDDDDACWFLSGVSATLVDSSCAVSAARGLWPTYTGILVVDCE